MFSILDRLWEAPSTDLKTSAFYLLLLLQAPTSKGKTKTHTRRGESVSQMQRCFSERHLLTTIAHGILDYQSGPASLWVVRESRILDIEILHVRTGRRRSSSLSFHCHISHTTSDQSQSPIRSYATFPSTTHINQAERCSRFSLSKLCQSKAFLLISDKVHFSDAILNSILGVMYESAFYSCYTTKNCPCRNCFKYYFIMLNFSLKF